MKTPTALLCPHCKKPVRRTGEFEENVFEEYGRYREGESLREIGQRYNISGTRVGQVFKKHDLATRTWKEAQRVWRQRSNSSPED